jgi:hypothetical protein
VTVTTLAPLLEPLTPELLLLLELLLLELLLELLAPLELLLVELPPELVEPLGLPPPPPPPPPPQPARTHRPSNTVQRKCARMPSPRYGRSAMDTPAGTRLGT